MGVLHYYSHSYPHTVHRHVNNIKNHNKINVYNVDNIVETNITTFYFVDKLYIHLKDR